MTEIVDQIKMKGTTWWAEPNAGRVEFAELRGNTMHLVLLYEAKNRGMMLVGSWDEPDRRPVITVAASAADVDVELIGILGRQLAEITAAIDRGDVTDQILDRLGVIEQAIINTSAATIDGMLVKARAACWALLGDLEPEGLSMEHGFCAT